ncbi:MAG TPA: amino acid permease [Burkholderiaceae bacterium]|nr:amino acid permease [Burkholderiaceae bacterium]
MANEHMSEDEKVLHGMGYAQELHRRMGGFQNFAISFSIICILSGGFGSFPIALSTGGTFSLTIGWLVGGAYALIVAAALGQIASAYPTAGGLYHWSSILGGRFWGWATAYVNLLGLLFVIPAVNVFLYLITKDLFFGAVLGWDVSTWSLTTQIVAVGAITAAQALLNHFGIRLTTLLTDFSGYLIFVVTILLIVMFLMAAPSMDLAKAFTFVNNTGEPGGSVAPASSPLMAFLIGLLYPLFTITGFDASAHTSEETVDARNAVPKGMMHSVLWSILFGFVLIITMILATPDLKAAAASGWSSFNNLFIAAILPTFFGKVLLVGVLVSNFLCALAAVTSTSRMVYAFARDDGLPLSALLKSVSPKYRTPVAAIWATAIFTTILTAITTPLGAFAALSTGCAMYLYISYGMPVIAGFFAEGKSWTTFGPFRLGGLYKVFAVIVMIGTVVVIIAGHTFVPSIAADAAAKTDFVPGLTYYSIGFLIFLAVIWFGLENRRFKGPPVGEEIAKRQAAIALQEKALSAGG